MGSVGGRSGLTGAVGYVLDPRRPTGEEIRRVLAERLDDAVATLDRVLAGDADDVERAVHDVRKRCKESRGAGRLVRPRLGHEARRFDALVRDAAGHLSEFRDAHALLATFDALLVATGDDGLLHTVRDRQAAVAEEASAAIAGGDERIGAARDLLAEASTCVERWDVGTGFEVVGDGLVATYRSGRRRLRDAESDPTDEDMHEWRKAVKYLWYQLRLLRDAAPSVVGPAVDVLDALGEALGEDHDLAVLVARLDAEPERFGDTAAVDHARLLARSQQDLLRARAFRAGATVFAESPKSFGHRIRRLWQIAGERGPELPVGGIAALAERPNVDDTPVATTVERERKFLVAEPPADLPPGTALRQGYLTTTTAVSAVAVRVRDAGACTLTVKAGTGTERTEIEVPIDRAQFEAAWLLTEGRRISKTRHLVPAGEHVVELDVFHGDHDGLVIAEVEFDSAEALESFTPPAWFGREVSDDPRYANAALASDGLPADPG
jgi:CYTH domain-containing protein/CHAD domain-containing protein